MPDWTVSHSSNYAEVSCSQSASCCWMCCFPFLVPFANNAYGIVGTGDVHSKILLLSASCNWSNRTKVYG